MLIPSSTIGTQKLNTSSFSFHVTRKTFSAQLCSVFGGPVFHPSFPQIFCTVVTKLINFISSVQATNAIINMGFSKISIILRLAWPPRAPCCFPCRYCRKTALKIENNLTQMKTLSNATLQSLSSLKMANNNRKNRTFSLTEF